MSSTNSSKRGSKDGSKEEQMIQQQEQKTAGSASFHENPVESRGNDESGKDAKNVTQEPSTPPGTSTATSAAALGEAPAPPGAILLPASLGVSPRLTDTKDDNTVMEPGSSLSVPPWARDGTNATELGPAKMQQQQAVASPGGGSSVPTAGQSPSRSGTASSGKEKGRSEGPGVASYASEIISLFTSTAGGAPPAAGAVSSGGQDRPRPSNMAAATTDTTTTTSAPNDSPPSDQQSNTSWDDIF